MDFENKSRLIRKYALEGKIMSRYRKNNMAIDNVQTGVVNSHLKFLSFTDAALSI